MDDILISWRESQQTSHKGLDEVRARLFKCSADIKFIVSGDLGLELHERLVANTLCCDVLWRCLVLQVQICGVTFVRAQ